jgi:hypothetical protein
LLGAATVNAALFEVPAVIVVTVAAASLILLQAPLRPVQPFRLLEIAPAKIAAAVYLAVGLVAQARYMQVALPLAVELYGLAAFVVALHYITSGYLRRLLGKAVLIFLLMGLIVLKGFTTLELVG